MQTQFIAHSLNSDTVNPFDQAIEQVVHEEGLPIIVTPYFSLTVIQKIWSEISSILQLVTDLAEIRNNIRSENEFEAFAQMIKNNQLTLYDIPSLHAKIFVRGTKALIGSANFTNSGLGKNHEASILINDAQFTLEILKWIENLTNGRDAINLEQLRSAYQSALTLKRVDLQINEDQEVPKTYFPKSIKVTKSKYGNKNEIAKTSKISLEVNQEVAQILLTVFPNKEDLLKALVLIHRIRKVVNNQNSLDRYLSVTSTNNRLIVLNLGQWEILSFEYIKKDSHHMISLCIDDTDYPNWDDSDWANDINFESINFTGKTYADVSLYGGCKGCNVGVFIHFPWNASTVISEKILQKWDTVILEATQAFHHLQSSSHMRLHKPELAKVLFSANMRLHKPELAEVLFSANSESLDLIYPPNK
jgi:hypothetical protein